MLMTMTYSVKIKHINHLFDVTTKLYRNAVDFFLSVCLGNWDMIKLENTLTHRVNYMEYLTVKTKNNPSPAYDFSSEFCQ